MKQERDEAAHLAQRAASSAATGSTAANAYALASIASSLVALTEQMDEVIHQLTMHLPDVMPQDEGLGESLRPRPRSGPAAQFEASLNTLAEGPR